ncbi:hypothetical protein CDL15_Pgr016836 [Punica granatum]|uniref:Protein kinase domain-containing protein n=1 Tax=Punica granatum TaxID=22663 RepID=A0A218WY52_PUNGR|nr:hypothetical protein CDL15_Pgr016836 [Punica granatum]PKI50394.1 hypothetical protein CRG98_029222 [Punica granatum]
MKAKGVRLLPDVEADLGSDKRQWEEGPVIFSPLIEKKEDLAFLENGDGLAALEIIGKGGCGEVYKAELLGSTKEDDSYKEYQSAPEGCCRVSRKKQQGSPQEDAPNQIADTDCGKNPTPEYTSFTFLKLSAANDGEISWGLLME